ncbi:hypothetical protein DXG01_002558 [Tephrocybe rancida]|nr:hypothetical protein DXG01_002558 [Tephrocybe rancida]
MSGRFLPEYVPRGGPIPPTNEEMHASLRDAYHGGLTVLDVGRLPHRTNHQLIAMNFARLALKYQNEYEREDFIWRMTNAQMAEEVKVLDEDIVATLTHSIVPNRERSAAFPSSDMPSLRRSLGDMPYFPSVSIASFDNYSNYLMCLKASASSRGQAMYMVFDTQASSSGHIKLILSTSTTAIASYMSDAMSNSSVPGVFSSTRAYFAELEAVPTEEELAMMFSENSPVFRAASSPPRLSVTPQRQADTIFENELELALQISIANLALEDPEEVTSAPNRHNAASRAWTSSGMSNRREGSAQSTTSVNCLVVSMPFALSASDAPSRKA